MQTVRADHAGKTEVEHRSADPNVSIVRALDGSGRVAESTTYRSDARILIELRERPRLDRSSPGNAAEVHRQREQLARDLVDLDRKLKPRKASKITRQYDALFSGVAATVDTASIAEIRRLPNVKRVREDAVVHSTLSESVPLIGAPTVWSAYSVNGAGVKVAVIDTGVDYTHPDLGGCFGGACKVAGGYDFVSDDNDPRDDHGHGTHVAGIIAANGTLKGVAPGATLLAYKVLDSFGSGFSSDIIAALERAVTDGAKVANLSLGGYGDPSDPLSQAVDNGTAAGLLSVVAAGNSGPSYMTVGSPGTARTALTVGAADKTWAMAWFSSRGHVIDGDQFVMKPELTAPGVSIQSTVPTSGALGNPSRYATLNGTSMATPHVAGAAALLLQWNAAQTPADLKHRLVASSRNLNVDPFTQGAGGIDLPAAFALPVLPSKTHVSFGVINDTSGTIVREQTLSIRNTAATPQPLSLTAAATLPAGATLEIVPASLTLQAGQSADVTVRLTVDAAVVPDPPDPGAWSTRLSITNGAQTAIVPMYFFEGALLSLSFDEAPWFIHLINQSGDLRSFYFVGESFSTMVKRGTWDVMVGYMPPVDFVVLEQQNLQSSHSYRVERSQATHALTLLAVDDSQQSLPEWQYGRDLTIGVVDPNQPEKVQVLIGVLGSSNYRVSTLSSRYLVTLNGAGPDSSGLRFFATDWAGRGVSSGVTLPTNVPYRRLGQTALPRPGTTNYFMVLSGFAFKATWGGIATLGGHAVSGPIGHWVHVQTNGGADVPVLPVHEATFDSNDNAGRIDTILGSYYRQTGGENLAVSRSPFFNLLSPSIEPAAVLGADVHRWDLETPPHNLPIRFFNFGNLIRASDVSWQTHTMSSIATVARAEPTFTLHRNGALVGTFPLSQLAWTGVTSEPGAHEFRSASNYVINGTAGSAQAVITFDTASADPHPPLVSRFRIEQNGLRTATPLYPAVNAPVHVKFRLFEDSETASATLEWRQSGTSTWTSLPLTQSGSDYDATLQQGGAIDLRVIATDGAGNKFEETWTPAFITAAAAPPSAPAFVRATRSGTAAISLNWAASDSVVGIAGYRIERLPDLQTFTTTGTATTYLDTTQLTPGASYLYRVSAIDANNSVSPPTAYDVATLVELADDPVIPQVTRIRGVHVSDLRRAVDAVRQAAGLSRAWTNYDPPTGVVMAQDFLDLRDRLNDARTAMQLPLVNFFWYVGPMGTIRARDLQDLRDGVK